MWRSASAAPLAALALLAVGCASAVTGPARPVLRYGGIDGGAAHLLTVSVLPRERVPQECRTERALACVWPEAYRSAEYGREITLIRSAVIHRADLPWAAYQLAAHESCHIAAILQGLAPDPCHREDAGVLHGR